MDSVKFNKLYKDKYFLLKDIAKSHNYSDELLTIITLIYISFYMEYGKKSDIPLYDLFNKIKLIFETGNVREISLRHGYGQQDPRSAAVTIFKPNFKVFQDQSLKQIPQAILVGTHVGDYFATPALRLEMLIHEIRHALMGYFNSNFLIDENTYYMRSGLHETFYTKKENFQDEFDIRDTGTALDEITNTYFTELLVNRIKSFSNYSISDSYLKSYLNSIITKQNDGVYRVSGYHYELKLLLPLLRNDLFLNLVSQREFDGDIDEVKDLIETYSNGCSYLDFCQLLDDILEGNSLYDREVQKDNVEFVTSHVNNIKTAKGIILAINDRIKNKEIVKKR